MVRKVEVERERCGKAGSIILVGWEQELRSYKRSSGLSTEKSYETHVGLVGSSH